jgi:hypothetical protein
LIIIDTGTGTLNSSFIFSGTWSDKHEKYVGKSATQMLNQLFAFLKDRSRSIGRCYANYFCDARKQDRYEMFLGYRRGSHTLNFRNSEIVEPEEIEDRELPPSEFVELYRKIQRTQDLESWPKSGRGWRTSYLMLFQQTWMPMTLNTWWDWFCMFVWMWFWSIWLKLGDAMVSEISWIPDPKSGRSGWAGDEAPLQIRRKSKHA